MPRFASVVTRDVSEEGVYLECRGGEPIPLYRLVYLQLERDGREMEPSPTCCVKAASSRRFTGSGRPSPRPAPLPVRASPARRSARTGQRDAQVRDASNRLACRRLGFC